MKFNRILACSIVASLPALGSANAFAQSNEAPSPQPHPPGLAPHPDVAPIIPADRSATGDPAGNAMGEEGRQAIEARLKEDEARLKKLEESQGLLKHLKLQGYVQAQYRFQSVNAAASPNRVDGALPPGISSNDVIAKADGTTTNTNLFRLRRTRLRTIYETDVMKVFLQIDVLPAGGPSATQGTIIRNAEATGIAHWTDNLKTEFTAGLFQIPFRAEVMESSMYRPYIERTFTSQSLFPTERDLGVHAKTIYGKDVAALDVGIINGQRLGEKSFALQPDLNGWKDVFATITTKVGPLSANVAGYLGRSQVVDAQALRVKNFDRRGVNVGALVAHTFSEKLGETKLSAELMFGSNMDTGALVPSALPTIAANFKDDVKDLNERGFYFRADQEITKWGIAGFRYDTYTTNSAIANNSRDTYDFMFGARFTKLLRLINEVTYTVDNLHVETAAPPSKHIYGYTAWLQGSFY